jgi:hypothetical protein
VLAADFYHYFGYDHPLHTLGHDALVVGPTAGLLRKLGFISASHENASAVMSSGELVIVFSGRRSRLADVDALRGPGEVGLLGHRNEVLQLPQFHNNKF